MNCFPCIEGVIEIKRSHKSALGTLFSTILAHMACHINRQGARDMHFLLEGKYNSDWVEKNNGLRMSYASNGLS